MRPTDLAHKWLELAEQQDRLGASAQASTLRFCAEDLRSSLEEKANEALTLQQAATESGYSADHLGKLVREGKIPNAGRPNAPRIKRADLPIKPEPRAAPVAQAPPRRHRSNRQVVQSIIDEGVA